MQPNIGASGEFLTIRSEIAFISRMFSCDKWTTQLMKTMLLKTEDDDDDDDVS